jgi:hypothetical protein
MDLVTFITGPFLLLILLWIAFTKGKETLSLVLQCLYPLNFTHFSLKLL